MSTPQPCLSCGYLLEGSTPLGIAAEPEPGDVSICLACGALGIFEDSMVGLTRRLATPEEITELRTDPDIVRALALRDRRIGDSLLTTELCGKRGPRFDFVGTGSCVFRPHVDGPHSWTVPR